MRDPFDILSFGTPCGSARETRRVRFSDRRCHCAEAAAEDAWECRKSASTSGPLSIVLLFGGFNGRAHLPPPETVTE